MIRSSQAKTMDSYDDLDTPPNNKWLRAFKASLRGRLLSACALGCVLGVGAAAGVFLSISPKFESTALVRVRSTTPTILRETGDTMGRYDQYLGAQVELIKSYRVTDMAMQSPEWVEIGRGFTPEGQYLFRSSLSVWNNARSEVISVKFADEDRNAARVGAAAVVDAYLDIFNEQELGAGRNRLTILESREADLRAKIDSLRDEINGLVQSQGREGVRQQYASLLDMRNQIEFTMQNNEDSLKVIKAASLAEDEEGGSDVVSVEDAARVSTAIASLLDQKQAIENNLRVMQIAGRGDEDRRIRANTKELTEINALIEAEIAALDPSLLNALTLQVGASEAELESRIQSQRSLLMDVGARIEDLGTRISSLNDLEKEESLLESKLAETRSRIDTLNLEASAFNRVELLTLDVSHSPVNDKKKLAMTGASGVAGFAAGFCVIGGLGMLGGRVRSSQDALLGIDDRDLIGLIPTVDSQSDPDSVTLAEQSIDHIRSMLQVGAPSEEALSVAVTGPISGSGKTSVSMLLGRSFAEAGYNTLLVDFDFVGQGLSAQFRRSLAPRIGDLLESAFNVSRHQIEQAAQDGDSSKPLGSKLCDMGLISEADLDRALHLQSGGADPLRRVIEGKPIKECVVKTRVKNLYALPLGQDDGGRVGQKAINQLLNAAKSSFEIVVMDTGPTPGAVEGGLAVASVTSVLVVVARGDERSDIETCDHFLRSVRAPVAGFVLNRADQVDLKSSHVSLSLSRRSQPGQAGGALDELLTTKGV